MLAEAEGKDILSDVTATEEASSSVKDNEEEKQWIKSWQNSFPTRVGRSRTEDKNPITYRKKRMPHTGTLNSLIKQDLSMESAQYQIAKRSDNMVK